MDSRVREHAETVVGHSTDGQPGDDVLVAVPPAAEEFVVTLYDAVAARDARPLWPAQSGRAAGAMTQAADPEAFETPEHARALVAASDVVVQAYARTNATEFSDVPSETSTCSQT